MAFFLKSSKIAFIVNKFYGGRRMFNLENRVFHFKKISLLNSSTFQQSSSVPKDETTEESIFERNKQNYLKRFIASLEIEANNNYFVNLNKVEESLALLNNKDDITLYEANLLIRSCGGFRFSANSEKKTRLAQKIVATLEKIGIPLNISHYNSLLVVYLQNEHFVSKNDFLNNLKNCGIKPNIITYQRLIKICCYQGNINAASEILETLKKEDLPIDKTIFNSLIYGHAQIKDTQGASDVLNIMEKKGVQPDAETYANLICAYANAGNIEKISSIFEMCEQQEISFKDEDLLHILFVLAQNNQNEYIENILFKLKKHYGHVTLLKNYIFRLLEKNYDSIALKLWDAMFVSEFSKKHHGKFIINFYIKNRSVFEILKICQNVEKKDVNYNTLSYAVEKITFEKDYELLLSILEIFKRKKIFYSPCYYWPVLIDASKISNDNFIKILNIMNKLEIKSNALTIFKIIGPFYVWGNDLNADLEKLYKAGVQIQIMSLFLLLKFINKKDFDNVMKLVHTAPIWIIRNFKKNVTCALGSVNDTDLFVEILHCVLHSFYNVKEKLNLSQSNTDLEVDNENTLPEETTNYKEISKIFAGKILEQWILQNGFNEVALVKVLKKMLEKGIIISLDTADFIRTQCNNDEINDLLNKLTNDNVKMLLNDKILDLKNKFPVIPNVMNNSYTNQLKKIKMLAENNEIEKAMELLNDFKNSLDKQTEDIDDFSLQKLYMQFLTALNKSADFEAVEKAYDIGVEINCLNATFYFPLVLSLITRNEIEKAVDLYCRKAKETGKLRSYDIIGRKVIELENSDLLQKLVNIFTEVYGEEFALSSLVYLFASLNKEKEIRKLLESQNFVVSKKFLRNLSSFLLRKSSEETIQCYLNATAGMSHIYREHVYKKLAELYIQNDDLPKLKNLLNKMLEEDIIIPLSLMEEVTDFYKKKNEPAPFSESIAEVKAF